MPQNLDFTTYFELAVYGALGLGALFGLLKGFKKSIYSFITYLILIVGFFLTIGPAADFLWSYENAQIGSLLGQFLGTMIPDIGTATSLGQAVTIALGSFAGEDYAGLVANPHLLELVEGIGTFVLKIVYMLLYFTIFWLLYKLICAIIYGIFLKGKSGESKYVSKNRLLGAVFGVMEAAVGVFVMLVSLSGLVDIVKSMTTLIPVEEEEVELAFPRSEIYEASTSVIAAIPPLDIPPELQEQLDMMADLVTAFESNSAVQLSNQLTYDDEGTLVPLTIHLFDTVLSIDYDVSETETATISLRHELSVIAGIAGYAMSLEVVETGDITTITSENVVDVFGMIGESDLITTLLPVAIEVAAGMYGEDLEIPTEDLYEIDWAAELEQLGVIAAVGFDIVNAAGFLDSGVDLNTVTVDGDLVRDLFDALAESDLVNLALLVAIEPVLEMAGEQISAIVTVPADIVWGDEFRAMGALLGAVLDTGITMGDVQAGDYGALISALATVDFTLLLDSQIITNAVINVLSGRAGIAGLEMIVIPEDLVWLDLYDDEGNLVQAGELRNILLALNAIVTIAADIDFENIGIQDISLLTDEAIDAIFESRVLVATLSEYILTLDLGGFSLVIPDSVFDENHYIVKTEFVAVAKALKLAADTLLCDEGDDVCAETGFDITKAFTLESDDLDILLDSVILTATIGKYVLDMDVEMLAVPGSALAQVLVDGADVDIVDKEEIKRVFAAVLLLGIDDFANLDFSLEILANLEGDVAGELDDAKLDTLFASYILRATIAKVLIDMTGGAESIIVVPTQAEDGTVVFYKDAVDGTTDMLSTIELKAILKGVYALDIDFENFNIDNIGPILDNIDLLLDSAILHATISDILINMEGGIIVVPDLYGDPETEIKKTVDGTDFIAKTELNKIIDALSLLEITSFDTLALDATIIEKFSTEEHPDELDEGKLDTMFASVILQASVSKMILDLLDVEEGEEAVVVIPDQDVDGNDVKFADHGFDYISVAELKAILRSFFVLGFDDFSTISFTDLGPILDNIPILLNSAVLHATISDVIIGLATPAPGEEAVVVVPVAHGDGIDQFDVQVTVGTTTFIAKTELTNIIDSLNILGISSTDSIAFDASIIDNLESAETPGTLDDAKLDTLFSSYILRATISKMLLDLMVPAEGGDALVIVPENDWDGNPVQYVDHELDYISEDELGNVLRALFSLGITDFSNVASLSLANVMEHFDDLIQSAILHATISDQILNIEAEMIVVPADYTRDYGLVTETDVEIVRTVGVVAPVDMISEAELNAMFDAIKLLGFTDFSVSLDASIISTLQVEDDPTTLDQAKLDVLFASAIIHASISAMFTDLTEAAEGEDPLVIVPETDWDGVAVVYDDPLTALEFIAVAEIQNVLSALNSLGITDFDNVANLSLANVMAHFDDLIQSAILHATISDQILNIEAEMIVIPEDYTRDYGLLTETVVEIVRNVGVVDPIPLIDADELSAMFDSLDLLGFTDFSVALDATVIDRLEDEIDPTTLDQGKLDILFGSAIIHASFSKMFFDLTDVEPGEEALVVVPTQDVDGIDVVYTDFLIEYVSVAELDHTLYALHALNVTDFGAVDALDMDTIIAELDVLLDSAIMHATISKQIIGIDMLVIPFVEEDDVTAVRLTVASTEFIDKSELGDLFDGLRELGITGDLSQFDGDVDYSAFFDDVKRGVIMSSAIMHAMISDTLVNFDPATVSVPFYQETGSDPDDLVRVTVGTPGFTTEYVKALEIHAFFVALRTLGITGNIEDFDGTINLEALFDEEDRDTILSSAIMQARISSEIFGLGDDVIAVPFVHEDGLSAVRVTVGADETATEYVLKTELVAVFESLPLLGFSGDIQGFDGTVSLASLFIPVQRATILTSASLQARISQELVDLDDATLAVPFYAATGSDPEDLIRLTVGPVGFETEYVTVAELGHMFDALAQLGFNGDIQNFDGTIDTSALFNDDAPVFPRTTVFASAIVHAKLSAELTGLGASLPIPYTAADGSTPVRFTVGAAGFETEYVGTAELANLFEAMELLGFNEDVLGEGFTGEFDLTPMFEPDDRTQVLASAVIHAKISEELVALDDATLAIPFTAADGTSAVRETLGDPGFTTEYIVALEIGRMFDAMELLGVSGDVLTAFDGTINLSALFEDEEPLFKRSTVLASAIIHAKISEELVGLGPITLAIPYGTEEFDELVPATFVRVTVGGVGMTTEYVAATELGHLFEGLETLGFAGDVLTEFSGDINISAFYDPVQRAAVLQSAILQAKVSLEMFNLGSSTMLVPTTDVSGTVVRLSAGPVGFETDYITKDEIGDLFDAMGVLGLSGDANFSGTVNLANLEGDTPGELDETKLNTLYGSATMHATISQTVIDLDDTDGIMIVPDYTEDGAIEANAIRLTTSGNAFVAKTELKSLVRALYVMGYGNLGIAAAIDTSKFFTETATILASAAMQATISDEILAWDDGGIDDALIIPNYTIDGAVDSNKVRKTVSGTAFIDRDELEDFFTALSAMGFADLDSFGGGISSSLFFAQKDTILLSAIMHATISDQILNDVGGALLVPNTDVENANAAIRVSVSTTEFITVDELKDLLDALDELGLSDFGTDVTLSAIFTSDFGILLASASMQATISDSLLASPTKTESSMVTGGTDLVVPTVFRDDITVGLAAKVQIEHDELLELLDGLDLLGISSFGGAMSAGTINALSYATQMDIYESGSLHVTVHNMLLGNPSVDVPDEAKHLPSRYGVAGLTTASEIAYFIVAVNELEGVDFTNAVFTFATVAGLDAAKRDVILDSMIIRNIITPDMVGAVATWNANPFEPDYTILDTDYMNDDPGSFFTEAGIERFIAFVNLNS